MRITMNSDEPSSFKLYDDNGMEVKGHVASVDLKLHPRGIDVVIRAHRVEIDLGFPQDRTKLVDAEHAERVVKYISNRRLLHGSMTQKRYRQLMRDQDLRLTPEEIKEGWWFCACEWDGLLIHRNDMEARFCGCRDK